MLIYVNLCYCIRKALLPDWSTWLQCHLYVKNRTDMKVFPQDSEPGASCLWSHTRVERIQLWGLKITIIIRVLRFIITSLFFFLISLYSVYTRVGATHGSATEPLHLHTIQFPTAENNALISFGPDQTASQGK